MKKLLQTFLLSVSAVASIALPAVITTPAFAATPEESICIGSGGTWKNGACSQPGNNRTVMGTFRQITSILIFLVGAISVIMIIIGGLKYTTSQGDQAAISSAKNTILYAIIGLVVAVMAFAIVNWLFDALNIS